MNYFIVTNNYGDFRVECVTREELLRRLNERELGVGEDEFVTLSPGHDSELSMEGQILVIKGESVVPTTKKVVEEYDVA